MINVFGKISFFIVIKVTNGLVFIGRVLVYYSVNIVMVAGKFKYMTYL
jgi:hypothetical protein